VYSSDGGLEHSSQLGDAIAHLLVDSTGGIWTGYFDEGVFGGGEYARHGLARFGPDLSLVWSYPPDTGFGSISDCYALNVDGDIAWAYYYTDFPIVKVGPDEVNGWTTSVLGAKALIVRDNKAALVGTHTSPYEVTQGELRPDGHFEETSRGVVRTEDGIIDPESGRQAWFSRGRSLHVFVERHWYRTEL